jgi:hypothetical protein
MGDKPPSTPLEYHVEPDPYRSPVVGAELRAHRKSLGTDGKRCGMVQGAIEAGDLTVVDAILGAPAVLSGIPANLHANLQDMGQTQVQRRPGTGRSARQGVAALKQASDTWLTQFELLRAPDGLHHPRGCAGNRADTGRQSGT